MANDDGLYWTVRNNWDGKLWPRLWPNERAAWAALKEETGLTKKTIQETCDWTVVKVKIVEAAPNAEVTSRPPRAID